MCGIFGIWNTNLKPVSAIEVERSTNILKHRGPDDIGFFFTNTASGQYSITLDAEVANCNFAFGFRRLAILDLSSSGHQPMHNPDHSQWIVFNGEIYNYIELRHELTKKGYKFYTATDTEVILNSYLEWGEACLNRFNGMWSFAIWDAQHQSLFCARDRFGIKPFYYHWNGETFAFASEIKSLLALPEFMRVPNTNTIYDFLNDGSSDHTEETFFKGVKQLTPAHCLILSHNEVTIRHYWDIPVDQTQINLNENEYSQVFAGLFKDAIRIHLRSDVPIGSCLSGGLDSSAIVCVANQLLFSEKVLDAALVGQKQKTFSACFDDLEFDERKYIEKVITTTNAEPNYIFPKPKQLLEDLQQLIWHQDEPFGSLSIYAQWCVMRAASKRGVKVTLDGQGSDEMLAGYHTFFDSYWANFAARGAYSKLAKEWQVYSKNYNIHTSRLLARTIRALLPTDMQRKLSVYSLRNRLSVRMPGISHDLARMARVYEMNKSPKMTDRFYKRLHSSLTRDSLPKLLHYEDRNSMAFSIESRVPFLDYRLVEYAFRIPSHQKIDHGLTKIVLRNAMRDIVPDPIRLRKDKMGFVTPEKKWMRGELSNWAEEIINSRSFYERGYFNVPEIKTLFQKYRSGQLDLTGIAWRWINLELWLRQMIDGNY